MCSYLFNVKRNVQCIMSKELSTPKERLLSFLKFLNVGQNKFEKSVGLSTGLISQWRNGNIPPKALRKITEAYKELNVNWLLTGEGEMLNASKSDEKMQPRTSKTTPKVRKVESTVTLPLVPIDAVAGYNGWDEAGVTLADCPQYSVPDFIAVKAEFLIRVSGSSMYPKYSSGDILACRKIQEIRFIQWGKIYIIDSSQGMMVKRLFEIDDDNENILCKSDNPNYPPFVLPKDDIRSLSIVVGAIRLE